MCCYLKFLEILFPSWQQGFIIVIPVAWITLAFLSVISKSHLFLLQGIGEYLATAAAVADLRQEMLALCSISVTQRKLNKKAQ